MTSGGATAGAANSGPLPRERAERRSRYRQRWLFPVVNQVTIAAGVSGNIIDDAAGRWSSTPSSVTTKFLIEERHRRGTPSGCWS
jgi:hypothetical protein